MDERKGKEFVAKKKWDLWQVALFTGVIIAMVVAMILLSTIWWMVAFLFVLVALSLYYMKNTFKAEYAYTVSQRLEVEILKSGGKRVEVCNFYLEDMARCGKYTKDAKQALTNAHQTFEAATDVKDDEATYYALFERDGKRNVLLFSPNEMMLNEMKKHAKCAIG